MKCGVYKIQHRASGRAYIGSSKEMPRRFYIHRRSLEHGRHHSVKLQRAWNKYGAEAFEFSVVLFCSEANQLFYEQLLIDGLNTFKDGYNMIPMAGSPAGSVPTEESRKNLKVAGRARAMKFEWKGQLLSIEDIAETAGIDRLLLRQRLLKGWPLLEAVTTALTPKNCTHTAFGKSLTFAAWAVELGVAISTLKSAVSHGRSIEEFALDQKRITVAELARLTGVNSAAALARVRRGWAIADAIAVPSGSSNRREFVKFDRVSGVTQLSN